MNLKQRAGKGGSAAKKHGETGSLPRNLPLLKKLFGKNAFAMYGTHKKSGTKEPYIIKIPAKNSKGKIMFRAVTLDASQSPTGKPLRTIMPMKQGTKKASDNIAKAWEQFLTVYGYPRVAPTKADPVRMTIVKESRGDYYEGMRLKKGKK